MKTILTLAIIAAGALAANSPEVPANTRMDNVPDDVADQLVKDGLAKIAEPEKAAKPVKKSQARLLVDSQYGKCNDLVELDAAELKAAEGAGLADSDKHAVAYAATLDQNKPKGKSGDVL